LLVAPKTFNSEERLAVALPPHQEGQALTRYAITFLHGALLVVGALTVSGHSVRNVYSWVGENRLEWAISRRKGEALPVERGAAGILSA